VRVASDYVWQAVECKILSIQVDMYGAEEDQQLLEAMWLNRV